MAKIMRVEYGQEDSIQVGDYKFIKPRIVLTADVKEDESYKDVLDAVVYEVKDRLGKRAAEIRKQYSK